MATSSIVLARACCSPPLSRYSSSPSLSLSPAHTFSSSVSSLSFEAGAIAPVHSGKHLNISRVRGFPFYTSAGKSDRRTLVLKAFAEDERKASTPPLSKKKSKLLVKPQRSPRLVLRFLWLEKNIGIGLDQVVPGHGTVPLSPFYFWPRKDAWEELKVKLESKPWISRKRTIILLNQATDIINLWQQSATIY